MKLHIVQLTPPPVLFQLLDLSKVFRAIFGRVHVEYVSTYDTEYLSIKL